MANIVELLEMVPNVSTWLVDLLVGVRVGVAWWLTGVNDVVAPRPPLKIGAAGSKSTPPRSLRSGMSWSSRSIRRSGVRWSLIVIDFKDLNCHCFKHGSGLGELRSLQEPA